MTEQIPQGVIDYVQREIRRSTRASRELASKIAEALADANEGTRNFTELARELHQRSNTIAWLEEIFYNARIFNESPCPDEPDTVTSFLVFISSLRVPDTQADRYSYANIVRLLTQNR